MTVLLVATGLVSARYAAAGQAPAAASDPDIPISHQDRVYSAEQYSNTVSVTDPVDNKLIGTIRLGDPLPANLSPLYKGQLLVHGMGFSPDHRTIAVVAIGSNAVNFIDTATNSVKHVTYVGRSPHEAFYTVDGKEVWIVVRGENYVSVLDGTTYEEKSRIVVPNGPGMTIFSPDGKYGYVCSSFTPETEVITVADHKIVGKVPQASPFCPNIAATPDSKQVWFTLKDTGKTQVFDGQPPFALLKTLDTGPITNHVNIVRNANGMFAYVTIGGLNEVKVFRTDNFAQVATIPTGKLPHGIWPSGDGTRVYVGLENEDKVARSDRDQSDRPGSASPRLRARCHTCSGSRNQQLAATRRGWPVGAAVARATGSKERGESAHERFAVRSGLGTSAGGRGHRSRARKALCACACE
jgi:DNA-binding beta-propeller fold protein YncE